MGKFGKPFKLEEMRPELRAQVEWLLGQPSSAAAVVATKGKAPDEKTKRALAVKFESAWASMENAPVYATEVTVVAGRQWRYDYCWIAEKVALELQGGIFAAGKGHVGAKGFQSDCDKLNVSNCAGVVVFKFATGQITIENLVMLRNFLLARRNELKATTL